MSEYQIPGGYLQYKVQGQHVEIVGASALLGEVLIPEKIEDKPVTVVDKKAFLSKKYLRKVTIPKTVEHIGDWAFAYCSHLQEIVLEGTAVGFGKAVFLDCSSLEKIRAAGQTECVSALLAAAVRYLEADYLLNLYEAGGNEWFEKWDARRKAFLETPDEDGYSKQVLCGEEDYGSTDFEAFKSGKRKQKVKISYLRLLYPENLQKNEKNFMEQYLRDHTVGCESSEAWQVLLEEYGNRAEYYKLFAQTGALTEGNLQKILDRIGADYPEMKAYFMSCFSTDSGDEMWANLAL